MKPLRSFLTLTQFILLAAAQIALWALSMELKERGAWQFLLLAFGAVALLGVMLWDMAGELADRFRLRRRRAGEREDAQWSRDDIARMTAEPYASDAYPLHYIGEFAPTPPPPDLAKAKQDFKRLNDVFIAGVPELGIGPRPIPPVFDLDITLDAPVSATPDVRDLEELTPFDHAVNIINQRTAGDPAAERERAAQAADDLLAVSGIAKSPYADLFPAPGASKLERIDAYTLAVYRYSDLADEYHLSANRARAVGADNPVAKPAAPDPKDFGLDRSPTPETSPESEVLAADPLPSSSDFNVAALPGGDFEVKPITGTLRMSEPDGTVTEAHIPVVDNGEVHTLNVKRHPFAGPGVVVNMDTVLPPVEYGPEALADIRTHGVSFHRVAMGEDGKPVFEHVPAADVLVDQTVTEDSVSWEPLELRPENVGMYQATEACDPGSPDAADAFGYGLITIDQPKPPARIDYDQRALRLLRPDPVGESQAEHRARYWEDRYDALNPDMTDDELQRRLLDRPMTAAGVRNSVAAVTEELRTYTPAALQLTGPAGEPVREADGSAMAILQDVQHLAMVRVADVGALAVSLAQDNEHLRNELNASMAMRQDASRALAAFDLDEDGTHALDKLEAGLDSGTVSKADAKALMLRMGWLVQQETVAVWVEPGDE